VTSGDHDSELDSLDRAIQRAEAAQAEVRTELQGLRLARDRRLRELAGEAGSVHGDLESFDTVPARVADWRAMPRTQAILRMLKESGGSLHRKVLTEQLAAAGRSDGLGAVSAALSYLEDRHRVTSQGQGWWRIGAPQQPMASYLDLPEPALGVAPLSEAGRHD
jgi:hypothetical protein